MPKLSKLDFIKTHKTGVCVVLQFPDYRSGITEVSTGKDLPNPNRVTVTLSKGITGDFAIQAHNKVQVILFADPAEAQKFASQFPHGNLQRIGVQPPCSASVSCTIDMKRHVQEAKRLGIF